MHVPIYRERGVNEDGTAAFAAAPDLVECEQQLMPLLGRFEQVHMLAGHNHRFINIPVTERIFQHALISVSAVLWKINNPDSRLVCSDGAPGGYEIFRFRGDKVDWQFKPNGYAADKNQFRVYDLNRVPEEFGGKPGSNRVLINVYNYDDQWQVSVRENGRELPVKRVYGRDPLYQLVRRDVLPTRPKDFLVTDAAHMFEVEASSAEAALDIKVTDRAGRVYKQHVERPKTFDWQIE